MGARHPQAVLAQLSANKNEFILAARHLVRTGICKSPGDAIRYMEEHNSNVQDILHGVIEFQRKVTHKEENKDKLDDDQTNQS